MKKPGKKEIRTALEDAMLVAVARMNFKPSKKSVKAISKVAKEAARFLKDDIGAKPKVKEKKDTASPKRAKKTE